MDISQSNILSICLNLPLPDRYRAAGYLEKLTTRVSARIARRYPYNRETFTGSIYFAVMCGLSIYAPLKLLVRNAKQEGETLNIHIQHPQFLAFTGWGFGETPFLMLACIAQAMDVPFKFHGPAALENDPVITLRLNPGCVPIRVDTPYSQFRPDALVSVVAFRDLETFVGDEEDVGVFYSHHAYRGGVENDIGFRLAREPFLEKTFTIGLWRSPEQDWLNEVPTVFSLLDALFNPVYEQYLAEGYKLVEEAGINKLYICDFPFMENFVLKEAVRARGGKVVLVPHGFHPSGDEIFAERDVDSILVPCWSSAKVWAQKTKVKIRIQSVTAKWRSRKKVAGFKPGHRSSIHIFACDEFIGFIPQTPPRTSNIKQYIDFLQGANDPQIDFRLKGRMTGISYDMLKNSPLAANLKPETSPPWNVEGDNMVFIFVGPATSGIYEAVGRGIPVLRIKRPDAPEYLHVDENAVPVIEPQEAVEIAKSLARGQGYDVLAEIQQRWFASEIRDGEMTSADLA